MRSLADRVIEAAERHPAIERVALVGSRARGDPNERSDWDFAVTTADFEAVAADARSLLAPLQPLAQQWDRLSRTWCWMALMPGPAKIDLIFAEPHAAEPPWVPCANTLAGIDDHFWDWALHMHSKELRWSSDEMDRELEKMREHILGPMGAESSRPSLAAAVKSYRASRARLERRYGVQVSRTVEQAVLPAIATQ